MKLEEIKAAVDAGNRVHRSARLSLTARGRGVYDAVTPVALDHEAALLDALSTEEQTVLDQILDKLTRRAAQLSA